MASIPALSSDHAPSDDAPSVYAPRSIEARLAALDCLRGLMLAIVLVDHIDFAAYSRGGMRHWTLMGLGFSDAAEGFVFLSGFVFGYVYGRRIEHSGYRSSARRGLFRALQIYFALILVGLTVELMKTMALTADWPEFWQHAVGVVTLGYRPSNTGILALYVVLLPWLLLLLPLLRSRFWWLAISISALIYIVAQVPALHPWPMPLRQWSFQPAGWQWLMVIAAWLGCRFKPAEKSPAWTGWRALFGLAVMVLAVGLIAKKYQWLPGVPAESLGDWVSLLNQSTWSGKASLAPLRWIHFFSLAYVTMYLVPLDARLWSSRSLEWLRVCGRHSLTLYCVGVVITQAIAILSRWWGVGRLEVLLATVDALALQVLIGLLLDSRYRRQRADMARRADAASQQRPATEAS